MPVIAIVNRKGGSGKSTLATHLAARYANAGVAVMLGDVDLQQSTQTWLRLRAQRPQPAGVPVVGWAVDPRRVLRPPAGVQHVVLDTPGGLRGFDLARVAGFADVILMPVCNSIFDRESAAECHAELSALPRVASGRCKVAAVGMRLDSRTRAAHVLQAWAAEIGLPFVGVIRETQAYVRWIEQGSSLFDQPAAQVEADLAQWQPILDWVDAAMLNLRRVAVCTVGAASLPRSLEAAALAGSRLGTSGSQASIAAAPTASRCGAPSSAAAAAAAERRPSEPLPGLSSPASEPVSAPGRAARPVLRNLRMIVAGLVGRLGGPGFAQRNP